MGKLSMQKPAQLKIVNRFGVTRFIPLNKRVFTIGRKAENDLQLLSDTVSRQHAEIIYEEDCYVLVDVGSKRGTFVNEQRVQRCALQHQDRLRIGGDDEQEIFFLDDTIERASAIFDSTPRLTISPPSQDRPPIASANEELQKLSRFVEVNQAFKFSMTPDDVLCLIVDAAIEITQAERGFLMLRNAAGNLEFKVARDRNRNWIQGNEFEMSRSVVEEAFKQNLSVIINDGGRQTGVSRDSVRNLSLRAIACIPLRRFQMTENMDATSILKRDVIGVLYVDSNVAGGTLTQTSLKLLESLAFEATKSLESVRLMHEEQEKKNLEQELNMARQVQVTLSPVAIKEMEHFEVAAHNIPSRYVGGDFYDLLPLKDDRFVFVLGDVSGKGVAAALLAAMAQGALQVQFAGNLPLTEVISSLNKALVLRSASNRFITLFCGVLDREGHFTYINAGHNLPILVRTSGETEMLTTKSVLLGAFDFVEYNTRQTRLYSGDVVVMYTDGVTEAVNADNDMFSDERLEELVKASAHLTAEQIKQRILDAVLSFTRGLPQGDDITLIVLKMR
ncbi:MAG TPA: SpoIIE family protein phosphatase [Blastocatellia bacterium]|nr:SpoIIE family protein phosphatase [Blastocatellia bacterium]